MAGDQHGLLNLGMSIASPLSASRAQAGSTGWLSCCLDQAASICLQLLLLHLRLFQHPIHHSLHLEAFGSCVYVCAVPGHSVHPSSTTSAIELHPTLQQ